MRWVCALVVLVASACTAGGGGVVPDGGAPPAGDAGSDAYYPACRELYQPAQTVDGLPARVSGELGGAGSDLISPSECMVVDAPYGAVSEGADEVIAISGLVAGDSYVVRLDSPRDDLAFYVVTGCSSASGPTASECLLFVDAALEGVEVGSFVATGPSAWVVVDYFNSDAPPMGGSFAMELYRAECDDGSACGGDTPVCLDHRCVECGTSFDCHSATAPVCDTAIHGCRPGYGNCVGDDARDLGDSVDDGPAGAAELAPGQISGRICNAPYDERDFFRFDVAASGEHWDLSLSWPGGPDVDLAVFDAAGHLMGASSWDQPERIALTYLPVGSYYARVNWYDAQMFTSTIAYVLSASRITGDACQSAADCARSYQNQVFRGDCQDGACVVIDGDGQVPAGGHCDSDSDCAPGTACNSFLFTADADRRGVCGTLCETDAECAGLGAEYVCTTYLVSNFCVPRCQTAEQCPTDPGTRPTSPPWVRWSCQTETGRCLPP